MSVTVTKHFWNYRALGIYYSFVLRHAIRINDLSPADVKELFFMCESDKMVQQCVAIAKKYKSEKLRSGIYKLGHDIMKGISTIFTRIKRSHAVRQDFLSFTSFLTGGASVELYKDTDDAYLGFFYAVLLAFLCFSFNIGGHLWLVHLIETQKEEERRRINNSCPPGS